MNFALLKSLVSCLCKRQLLAATVMAEKACSSVVSRKKIPQLERGVTLNLFGLRIEA